MVDIRDRDIASHKKILQLEGNLEDANERYNQLRKEYRQLLETSERMKSSPRNIIEVCYCLLVS